MSYVKPTAWTPQPPPPQGDLVFESDWSTALGQSANAVTDGYRWDGPIACTPLNGILEVVDPAFAVPGNGNCLRVQQRGSTACSAVTVDSGGRWTGTFYMRGYFRCDDTGTHQDHGYEADYLIDPHTVYMSKTCDGATGAWCIQFRAAANNIQGPAVWPIHWWGVGDLGVQGFPGFKPFQTATWYRYELGIEVVTPGTPCYFKMWPRVYSVNNPGVDDDGTLLFDYQDWVQTDYLSGNWNGRNDWTLELFYDAGYYFRTNTGYGYDEFERITVGNNGQQDQNNTGLYWYWAQYGVSVTDWCGPI